MGYFSRIKKAILAVFLFFATIPLLSAGIYMIYLGATAAYRPLVIAGIAAAVFSVAALTAATIIMISRINPIENAADKLLDTFAEEEKEVIRLSSGKSPSRFIGGTIDYITGERMVTEGQAGRQCLIEAAVLCADEIIWMRDGKEDRFIVPESWNRHYDGFSLENGTVLEEYIHPEDRTEFASALQVVCAASGRSISVNFRLRCAENEYIPVCIRICSQYSDGKICAAGSISDINKLDELEVSVREKYLMFDFAVRAVTDIIYEMDTEHDRFTILNKERWNEMFDLPLNGAFSLHRSGYAELVHPDYFKGFTERFSDYDHLLFMPERTLSYDYPVKKRDGSWCWVRHTVFCVKERNGHTAKIVGLITDLSEKNHTEQQEEQK
ncbi:MAG: PAS domain-containing protein [Ruminiclostridium sp.]|nr:PAS domain-containing protein [Ruminiclostridium sp.]